MNKSVDYYDILGVPPDASADEIKKRYKELVLKFHPDRTHSSVAGDAMVLINNAYEVLSDPKKRAAYDAMLQGNMRETVSDTGTSYTVHSAKPVVRRKRAATLLVSFIVFSIACHASGQVALSDESTGVISDQFVENAATGYSALLNAMLSIPLFIPGFGVVWGVLAGLANGVIYKAALASPVLHTNGPAAMYLILTVKTLGYSVGMSRSMLLAGSIWKRKIFRDLVPTICDAAVAVSILSSVGFLEHVMVSW